MQSRLLDEPATIRKKIARATTDSQPSIDPEDMGAGIANLFSIAQACDSSIKKEQVAGMRYGDFKKLVAEAVIARLEPIQVRYREITADPSYLDSVLRRGREHVLPMAEGHHAQSKSCDGSLSGDLTVIRVSSLRRYHMGA